MFQHLHKSSKWVSVPTSLVLFEISVSIGLLSALPNCPNSEPEYNTTERASLDHLQHSRIGNRKWWIAILFCKNQFVGLCILAHRKEMVHLNLLPLSQVVSLWRQVLHAFHLFPPEMQTQGKNDSLCNNLVYSGFFSHCSASRSLPIYFSTQCRR